jgi:hypothetical protein
MSRYIMIRRLRGPAFLLLVGVLALLNQAGILSWGHSWPFFLILAGLLKLAERAAMASEGGYPPYPGSPYPGAPDYRAAANIPIYPGQPEPYIPLAHHPESNKDSQGGQS